MKRLTFKLLVIALLLGVGAGLAAQPAGASGGWLYRWELRFPFSNNSLDGVLTVWLKPPNQPVVSSQTRVPCVNQGVGNVTIIPFGIARFPGNAYLLCDVPSIDDEVRALSGGAVSPGPFAVYDDFWMRTVTLVDPASTPSSGNPLISHPSYQYFEPVDGVNGTAQIRSDMNGISRTSNPFALGGADTLVARHRKTPLPGNACIVTFHQDGVLLNVAPFQPAPCAGVTIDLQAKQVQVGHNAVTSTTYTGFMDILIVDPKNPGVLD